MLLGLILENLFIFLLGTWTFMMKTFLAFRGRSAPWPPGRRLLFREGWPSGDVSPNLTVNCKVVLSTSGLFAQKSRWKSLDLTFTITPQSGPPCRLSGSSRATSVELQPGPSQDQRLQGSPEFKRSSATGSHLTDFRQAFLLIFTALRSFANL